MISWHNLNEDEMKKNPEQYMLWETVFRINYGLQGTKLDREYVQNNWHSIAPLIDPDKKQTLEYMLSLD